MKAAVFYGFGKGVKVEEYPRPAIGAGEILVRVKACGLCQTDLHYIDHGTPTFKTPPLILGHETSGIVEEVAEDVKGFQPGDRVLIPPVVTCGVCEYCRMGRENICLNMRMFGNHMDGAFAEFVKAPAKDVFHLPESLPLEESCIISDAVSTPYHALVNRAQVKPGEWVVIIGCGGVGMNAVQIASLLGARVIAVDIDSAKLQMAMKFGARQALNPKEVDVPKAIRKITAGGADVSAEVIGNPATIETALACLKTGGRALLIGYATKDAVLPAGRVMFRELQISGSLGCRPVDYPKIIALTEAGKIQVQPLVTHRYPLEQFEEALNTLRSGACLRTLLLPA